MKSWVVSQTKNGEPRVPYESKVGTLSVLSVLIPLAIMALTMLITQMDVELSIGSAVVCFGIFAGIIAFTISRNRSQFHAFILDDEQIYWAVFFNESRGRHHNQLGMQAALAKAQKVKKMRSIKSVLRESGVYLFKVSDIQSVHEISFAYEVRCRVAKRKTLYSKDTPCVFGESREKTILVLKDIEKVEGLIQVFKDHIKTPPA